jgi:hypothetical protein
MPPYFWPTLSKMFNLNSIIRKKIRQIQVKRTIQNSWPNFLKINLSARYQWLTPIILATWEAGIRRIEI